MKQVLQAQAATGIVFEQSTASSSPEPQAFTRYELGRGNCHGFSFHIFQLYESEPVTQWSRNTPDGTREGRTEVLPSAPVGVPTVFGKFPPQYQVVNVLYKEQANEAPKVEAVEKSYSQQGGMKWAAYLSVGKNTVIRKIVERGGRSVTTPEFGDLGLKRGAFDHSAIVLGSMGSSHVYLLQKDTPDSPYVVTLSAVSAFDWYRR